MYMVAVKRVRLKVLITYICDFNFRELFSVSSFNPILLIFLFIKDFGWVFAF